MIKAGHFSWYYGASTHMVRTLQARALAFHRFVRVDKTVKTNLRPFNWMDLGVVLTALIYKRWMHFVAAALLADTWVIERRDSGDRECVRFATLSCPALRRARGQLCAVKTFVFAGITLRLIRPQICRSLWCVDDSVLKSPTKTTGNLWQGIAHDGRAHARNASSFAEMRTWPEMVGPI